MMANSLIIYMLSWSGPNVPARLAGLILVISVGFTGCRNKPGKSGSDPGNTDENPVKYASGFRIHFENTHPVLEVFNPWQEGPGKEYSFDNQDNTDQKLEVKRLSRTCLPSSIRKVVILSTTHAAFLEKIGELGTVSGVSGAKFLCNPFLRTRVDKGQIVEVGFDQALDYEKILQIAPDLIFVYGVGKESLGYVAKLEELGLRVFFVGEYLEETPLGRAEWLKAFGVIYGKLEMATGIFDSIASAYTQLKGLTLHLNDRPTVLTGLPWRNTWYMPGGNTYLAELIRDAGGRYLWDDLTSREPRALGLEEVFSRALPAHFWINTGTARSLAEIKAGDERLAGFQAFHSGLVFNNNARISPGGGIDYWESGCVNPQAVLADLIRIFHPEILPQGSLFYYHQLK